MHMVSLFMGLVLVKGVKPRLILSATISYCILMSVVNSTTFHTLFSPLYFTLSLCMPNVNKNSCLPVMSFYSLHLFSSLSLYFTLQCQLTISMMLYKPSCSDFRLICKADKHNYASWWWYKLCMHIHA